MHTQNTKNENFYKLLPSNRPIIQYFPNRLMSLLPTSNDALAFRDVQVFFTKEEGFYKILPRPMYVFTQ